MAHTFQLIENFTEITTKSMDERKRTSISEMAGSLLKGITKFKIFQGANGDVLLRPVVKIPAHEMWLYKNKSALKMVKKGLKESAEGKAKKLDFSMLAPEE